MEEENGQPAWMRNSGSSPSPAAQQVNANNYSSSANANGKSGFVRSLLIITNTGLMVFMAATGALAIYHSTDVQDTGVVFVGIYLMIFAAILFTYEVLQIAPCVALDNLYKKNFGFLYGLIGKCLFLVFMGVLCFGLTVNQTMAIACGVIVCAWGFVQMGLYMKWPDYFDKREKYNP